MSPPAKRNLGQIAMGAALALLAGPVALFKFVELAFYLTSVSPGRWISALEPTAMPVSIVVMSFAGLVTAYGVRMIIREFRSPTA
ncbi:MAG: hypothetical protein MH112_12245 [Phenylobacterium sp.]|jgi:hypothetical protein|uniref:hypothetical protein n=1 Tax=Phenylobacterium sp. TaxID=1871053 RepID=UPI0025F6AD13|nr:hypothetical protein [Phenylobacterium sp.]MCG9917112.1 hypothetical protein [Phenylobacterium sp.]